MKGFMKRDWLLMRLSLRFYLLFILVVCLLAVVGKLSPSFGNTYLILFSAMSIMNLFSFDEANQWTGYATAMPNGRKAMVDARYILALCICVGVMLMQFAIAWPDWVPDTVKPIEVCLASASIYGGTYLCYTAIVLPIFYRFGSLKSRLVLVVIMAILFGVLVGKNLVVTMQSTFPRYFLLVGLAAIGISWPISRAIVKRKEF